MEAERAEAERVEAAATKAVSEPGGKKKPKRKIPAKYLAGLSPEDKKKRRKEIQRNAKKSAKDPSAYVFPSDTNKSGARRKTKESVYTKKFRKMFGGKKT